MSLSWCAKLPMAYLREQEQHLCYIIVDKEYAFRPGVVFTDRNAADNQQHRNEGLDGLRQVDFNAVKSQHPYPSQEIKKRKQAEVLIPNYVPLSAIKYVVFRSESSSLEAQRICTRYTDFCDKFRVSRKLFHLPSSYAETHTLTSELVKRDNVRQGTFTSTNIFGKSNKNQTITLLVLLYGINGTNRTVRFLNQHGDTVYEEVKQFSQTEKMRIWSSVELSHLLPGHHSVEFYLSGNAGDIRQFTLPFLVMP